MELKNILGIKYPIIQGGMARIATGAFAAAVSNAGGIGLIASGGISAKELREQIKIAKGLTDKPFGVNIMLMDKEADACAEVVVSEGVKFVTTGAGTPDAYMPAWKEAGIIVFPVVASVATAKRAERSGADGVIAEGTEAGGHIGEITTMALVPQVKAAVSIPVAAAGGIASGEQMLAALSLGACGVQIGTALLAATECPIHENYKQALLKAKDIDSVAIGRIGGIPVRVLRNQMSRNYIASEKEGATKEELEEYTLGALKKAVIEGDVTNGSLMAGQIAGMIKEIRPVKDILDDIYNGAIKTLDNMKGRLV
ncbi:MAG: nitronate monooxygenase [Defluviitaleaceae bacterium]|nr:nitronate monooxygenase [Defluviitaleaceae bacterium]